MRIERLLLENFHGFERREITFSERFTVLIGDNGSGKTSILDGVAVGLGAFLYGIEGVDTRNIQSEEVRRNKIVVGEITTMELQVPTKVICSGKVGDHQYDWQREVQQVIQNKLKRAGRVSDVLSYAKNLREKVASGQEVTLPLLVYYGTDRLHGRKKDKSKSVQKVQPGSRLVGYQNCLEPASSWKLFEAWFFDMVMIELQRQTKLDIVNAVRKAVSSCVETWTSIDFDFDSKEVVAIEKDGTRLPFHLLSDGVRNMLSLVADIAYRMAILNPHLRDKVITDTPGVVLIDELDLHLHPIWQRKVVQDLKETFPNVQFIVTTHSPFIVQSLAEGELRWLQETDNDEQVEAEKFVNQSLEDIVENVMEIPFPLAQRSRHLQQMYDVAKQYYELLDQVHGASSGEIQRLKEQLDELSAPYSENVAYYAFLERKRLAAGMGRDDDETD